MRLSEIQAIFAGNVARLILKMNEAPYTCTLGEAYRTTEQAQWNAARGIGIANSLHCQRLAIDLMLFKDGVYCSDSEAYRPFGEYWVTLNSLNRWGGSFTKKDGNHFEMQGP